MAQASGPERYEGAVAASAADDLDLLGRLLRVSLHQPLVERAHGLAARIVDAGLADRDANGLILTHAGVQRCKSLQHRVAADQEAVRVLGQRGLLDLALGEHRPNTPL